MKYHIYINGKFEETIEANSEEEARGIYIDNHYKELFISKAQSLSVIKAI